MISICRLTRSPRMHPMGKFLFRQLMISRLVERYCHLSFLVVFRRSICWFNLIYTSTLCIFLWFSRRQVWQCHRDHPELSKIPIKQPIFILGFPRAGSTFLFNCTYFFLLWMNSRFWFQLLLDLQISFFKFIGCAVLAKDPDSRFLTLWEQMDSEYKPVSILINIRSIICLISLSINHCFRPICL